MSTIEDWDSHLLIRNGSQSSFRGLRDSMCTDPSLPVSLAFHPAPSHSLRVLARLVLAHSVDMFSPAWAHPPFSSTVPTPASSVYHGNVSLSSDST